MKNLGWVLGRVDVPRVLVWGLLKGWVEDGRLFITCWFRIGWMRFCVDQWHLSETTL